MKTVKWILIACRIVAIGACLTFLNSGCGDQGGISGGVSSEEEVKRDADTRKAMEAASQAPKKK